MSCTCVQTCIIIIILWCKCTCASGDWLTSRPKGCSQPRELWFFDILMYMYIHIHCTYVICYNFCGESSSVM